ncbi:MAG: tetratricopeptide repeat protein [Planctomycetota bacterium]|nr:tetratricopeptide repeat protein [Planctomycetota bacterium]
MAGILTSTLVLGLVLRAGTADARTFDDPPTAPPPGPSTPPPSEPPANEAAPTSTASPEKTPASESGDPSSASPTGETPPASTESDEEPETLLTLTDGRQVSGFLIRQDDTKIYLKVAGIDTGFDRSGVTRTEVMPPVSQRYRELRAAISDDDADRLVILAEWLRARKRYDDALKELEAALKADPSNRAASELKILVSSQRSIALKAKERAARERTDPSTPAAPAPAAASEKDTFPRLSPEDVNIIRVYEVDLTQPPRMVIGRDVVEDLLKTHAQGMLDALRDRYNGSDLMRLINAKGEGVEALRDGAVVAAIASLPAHRILELMFDSRVRARELYARVRVLDDPPALKVFRESVQGSWLINSCATSKCHGGEEAGRLWLASKMPATETSAYTNFIILSRFKLADGTPLIDLEKPEASPLMQLGMVRKASKFPHPPVPSGPSRADVWRPVFRETSERRFKEAVQWIAGLYRPRPDYPITYETPVPEAVKKAEATKRKPDDPGR